MTQRHDAPAVVASWGYLRSVTAPGKGKACEDDTLTPVKPGSRLEAHIAKVDREDQPTPGR
ncbi:hypothetical protein [Lichenibacterium dinghuense]|uniref:hypothetical protein n=1 Tax=Lichenibacterium dinghuense TaxID=2895977 RepID=UPI001F3A8D0A|nr:hypothetical protein [Lichenibacterium sp. 6Y81]